MWPEILKKVPDATLSIFYGWNFYDKMHAQNPDMMKKKWEMIRMMSDPSITDHGRVSHKELAEAMKEIKVFAYPTEFTEINCITALKAQEAGCIPVTTLCYALETSVADMLFNVPCKDIYTNKIKQKEFITQIVTALKIKDYKPIQISGCYWPEVAEKWNKVLE
jgi:glycosyltransferase involved in cell wall biosynthesis